MDTFFAPLAAAACQPPTPSANLSLSLSLSNMASATESVPLAGAPTPEHSFDPYGALASLFQMRRAVSLPCPALPPPPATGPSLSTAELVWSATGGDLARVKEILSEQPDKVDEGDEDGSTPLIAAAWTNHVEVVEFLLERKANIDWANKSA